MTGIVSGSVVGKGVGALNKHCWQKDGAGLIHVNIVMMIDINHHNLHRYGM